MKWKTIPLVFRISVAHALLFSLTTVAAAQSYGPAPSQWDQQYQSYQPTAQQYAPQAQTVHNQYSSQSAQGITGAQYAPQPQQQRFARVRQEQLPHPSANQQQYTGTQNSYSSEYTTQPENHYRTYAPQSHSAPVGAGLNGYAPGCYSDNCDTCNIGYGCVPPQKCKKAVWSVRGGGLFLVRDDADHFFFSFDGDDESFQLLDWRDVDLDAEFGAEAWISRIDCCTQRGFEVGYWGTYADGESISAFPSDVSGDLNGIFNFDQLDYNGATADNFVNGAMVHRLTRDSEIHNFEANWVQGVPLPAGYDSGWRIRAIAGFRYFRMEENLDFASDTVDTTFTGADEELHYTIDTENDLYGFQLGADAERRLGFSRWSATWGAKAGVFANDAEARSFIGGAAGTATVNNGPNVGREWDIRSNDSEVAFLGELQAGLGYQLSPRWRLLGQYRVVGISGVALPTNQTFLDLRGLQDVELISTDGSLFLHGATFGAEMRY